MATFTNEPKSADPVYTKPSKNSATFTNQNKTTNTARFGTAKFGESQFGTATQSWTNETKH